jgi:hypothetical protein
MHTAKREINKKEKTLPNGSAKQQELPPPKATLELQKRFCENDASKKEVFTLKKVRLKSRQCLQQGDE